MLYMSIYSIVFQKKSFLLNVPQPLGKEVIDMLIVKRIEGNLTRLGVFHQLHVPQHPDLPTPYRFEKSAYIGRKQPPAITGPA